ncbi:MAG: family 1 extracellular solute-binding protein [Paenibacillaceae bacterium]|jgi:multiple sugar transport system substrate-binding protein|nr:family 1 extracellular solute-binding protein [Paenibacillaceae bacterium]
MNKMLKWSLTMMMIAALLAAAVGCGRSDGPSDASGQTEKQPPANTANSGETKAPEPKRDPVQLSVYQLSAVLTDADFDKYFVQPVKKKFPNITLTLVRNANGTHPEELVTAGNFPDIVFTDNNSLYNQLASIDNRFDLNPLVKQNKLDPGKFDKVAIEGIQMYGDNGELFALPFSINWNAMFYNKDIFDKFAMPYPKDLMSWDETVDLAKKVTRESGGVQYRGIDPGNAYNIGSGLSLPVVDRKTNKAQLNTESWQKVYTKLKEIYDIPGNLPDIKLYGKGVDTFLKDKTLAMTVYFGSGTVARLEEMYNGGDVMNWDMVSTPNFQEARGRGQEINLHILTISNSSKHKQEAFDVLSTLVSEDVQTLASNDGRISSLSNPQLRKSFAANLKSVKGKNIEGVFKTTAAKLPVVTPYDALAKPQLNNKMKEVIGGKDINTALREAEEQANKAIQTAIGKK